MLGVGSTAPLFGPVERLTTAVLLAFFKMSCPACQLTFPFLQRLADRGGPRVVGVSQDDAEGTAEFKAAFGVRFETVIDEGYEFSGDYGLEYVPSLFLVEPDGRISWKSEAFVKADLEELAARWGVTMFDAGDRVPKYKPG